MMKTLFVLLASLALAACSLDYNPSYHYNHVMVANLSGETIRDLKVQVGPEGRVVQCDEVTDKRICNERFGRRPYPNDVVDISWVDAAGEAQNRQANPSVPLTLQLGPSISLMVDILEDGSVKAYFRQDEVRYNR